MADTFPSPELPSVSEAEDLLGATHQGTQVALPVYGTAPDSSPSLKVQFARMIWLMEEHLKTVAAGRVVKTATLQVGAFPCDYRKSDGTAVRFEGATGFAVTASQTNYVYVLHATNLLTKSTTSFPADITTFTPLAEVVCDGSDITGITDRRGYTLYQTNASSASPTGTTATSFLIDSDNAGAEVDTQIRFQRGSTDAEDAAVHWDAANDRFYFFSQHSTETLCPIEADGYFVDGTEIIDGSGLLTASGISTTVLYVFGANGATAYGIKLTPAGATGGPVAGAHTAGELHVDDQNELYICAGAGTPGTWQKVANQGLTYQWNVGNGAGAAPGTVTVSIQLEDLFGNNAGEVAYVEVGVFDDADGAADAVNATIDNTPTSGTFLRWVTTDKKAIFKTTGAGLLQVDVTDAGAETVYLLVRPVYRSRLIDCQDSGQVVFS